FKLGAIRMTQRFFPEGIASRKAVKHAREHVRSTIAPFAHELKRHPVDIAVGSSGTIENLATMALALSDEAPQSLNGAVLTRDGLAAVIEALLAAETVEERALIPGIDSSRVDIIVGGALILEQVMDSFHLEGVTISEYALREGVLFDLASRIADAQLDHLSDIRRRSIAHLMEICEDDPEHSMQVARLALQLFDRLETVHGLGHDERELLEAAALLANVGLFIAHSKHHQHSYYVIRNSDHLSGFTDPEIELIAQVARYHRRSWPSAKHAAYAALDEHGQRTVSWLAAMVRIGIGLDRAYTGAVAEVRVAVAGDAIHLAAVPSNGGELQLEIYAAKASAGLLERLSGREVLVSLLTPAL
ncbi:MAG: HD domain-containing protein, partial [Actinobacteria bacterium]|nr:HD domain-containing protein [Actinomycetota bacterium]